MCLVKNTGGSSWGWKQVFPGTNSNSHEKKKTVEGNCVITKGTINRNINKMVDEEALGLCFTTETLSNKKCTKIT